MIFCKFSYSFYLILHIFSKCTAWNRYGSAACSDRKSSKSENSYFSTIDGSQSFCSNCQWKMLSERNYSNFILFIVHVITASEKIYNFQMNFSCLFRSSFSDSLVIWQLSDFPGELLQDTFHFLFNSV